MLRGSGLHSHLSRHHLLHPQALSLIVARIIALVTVLASAATAAAALSQSNQNAEFVNRLAHNTSLALNTQSAIDVKLEAKLDALEAIVIGLGDQIQDIKFRQKLQCYA